jgi:serine/threonine-protein kinase
MRLDAPSGYARGNAMTALAPAPDRPGRLGDFTLQTVLGEGGSATVYAASSPRQREVALKVLHAELALSERERKRFFDEVRSMGRVRHPSLVAIVDSGVLPDGRPYLCMPLLRGETLAVRIVRGRLPVGVALRYVNELADGVAALHRARMVHRDVKPENVFLQEPEGRAILLDFGIARDVDRATSTTTRTGGMRGTPAYMAPERFFGAAATVASDIYELAVVSYMMLVGRLPWDDELDGAARLHPRAPSDFGVDLPGTLADVLMRALSTRPEVRPESADGFAADAQRALGAPPERRASTADDAVRPPAGQAIVAEDEEPKASRTAGSVLAGRYRLDRLLGMGGMGEVWAATHELTGRPAALKLLRSELAHQEQHRRRFLREARVAGTVRHPNVIPILDVIELADGVPMMIMDLLEGQSLRERLDQSRSLTLRETAGVLLPVISAVGTAHQLGVVHRDLKPENIFLARVDGRTRVIVLDFGIAKVTPLEGGGSGSGALTAEGTMLGTPFYMSPEQIYGEPDVDHRSDVWAIGVILYECLTGRRPTEADNLGQILKIITQSGIARIEEVQPDLPASLSSVVMAALAPRREDRPGSLQPLYDALRAYCDEAAPPFGAPSGIASHVPSSREVRPESGGGRSARASRRATVWAALAILVLAAGGLVAWGRAHQRTQQALSSEPRILAGPASVAASAPVVALPAFPSTTSSRPPDVGASSSSQSPSPATRVSTPKPAVRPPRTPPPAPATTPSASWLDQR